MTTYTVISQPTDEELWSGRADDWSDAIVKMHEAHNADPPDRLERARKPEWAADWIVTSEEDDPWLVRAADPIVD